MNGFISPKALRFTLVTSACLLSGFVSGANFNTIKIDNIFSNREISYSKINWISAAINQEKVSLATVDYPASNIGNQEIKLADFHLEKSIKNYRKVSLATKQSNLDKLANVVAKINTADLFQDFQVASKKLSNNFIMVMNNTPLKTESIVIASSSATKMPLQAIATKYKMSTHHLNTQKTKPNIQLQSSNAKINEPIIIKPIEKDSIKVNIEQSSAQVRVEPIKITENNDIDLGKKIENALLEKHIESYVSNNKIKTPVVKNYKKPTATPVEDEIDHNNDVQNDTNSDQQSFTKDSKECSLLPKMNLLKPTQNEIQEATQICPSRKTWISKNWNEEGWVKVETEGYFPLLSYYPQVSSNGTLLLDQNSVALLAIKSGVHYSSEMGMILGKLPDGYKIEFSGRSEEVEYFELNAKKYFIILNVEPGAGVVELVSQKKQDENTTIFTPVLSGTVTYLDLVAPITINVPIKIIKGEQKDSQNDLIGLTVGISTQTEVQTKTNANGLAILRNINVIPGYPVFVDVSSKLNGEKSYQYRYQLNKRTRKGVFILKQYPEKLIYTWLKQVNINLNDQSGMILGEFNSKKIDAFRNHYIAKIENLTEKFGLETKSYSVLCDQKLSLDYPLEGLCPRFLSVQVPEGLVQAQLVNENKDIVKSTLIPVSPRVINVLSE